VIRQVTDAGLNDEGQETVDAGDQAYLCQAQGKLGDKLRQERIDEGGVEIADKMDKAET
jgi:hypothetical protein